MSKKKFKKMLRRAMKKEYAKNMDSGFGYADSGPGNWNGDGFGQGSDKALGKGFGSGFGFPRGLGWRSGQTEQFILGAVLGAAGAYVLADEELRGKVMKSAMKLYSGFTGGIEEFKEQMADLKAELEAGHSA